MSALTQDERRAIALYAVASRDFEDFLDMIREPETTNEALATLHKMCSYERTPNDGFGRLLQDDPLAPAKPASSSDDVSLNRLMCGPIEREIARRTSSD